LQSWAAQYLFFLSLFDCWSAKTEKKDWVILEFCFLTGAIINMSVGHGWIFLFDTLEMAPSVL
jgi:hypothetical protein